MAIITRRDESLEIFEKAAEDGVSIAIFGTTSTWNTEAILMAADRIGKQYGLKNVPVVISNTFTYSHMPQAARVLCCREPKAGLISHMGNLQALCGDKYSPYYHIQVLPHLDHADPERDRWALTVGSSFYSSVMFDAQRFPYEKNVEMTRDYVQTYGRDVLVEGIMETLSVGDTKAEQSANYCERAVQFVGETGVDFLVADLGTEQQAATVGNSRYDGPRARQLTAALKKKMLVLHGTSSLSDSQIRQLSDDGVIRVNMWTRIARESGQYGAEKIVERIGQIRSGEFDAADSFAYTNDCAEKAAEIMTRMLDLFGYANWT